jgi:hypothetical protein
MSGLFRIVTGVAAAVILLRPTTYTAAASCPPR